MTRRWTWCTAPCVDVFLAIEINYDGALEFCGQDADRHPEHIVGRLDPMTIHQAWHSKKMEDHRQAVGREVLHDRLPICQNCYPNTDKYDLLQRKILKL